MFRTFGADICEVMDELNMFAAGQHPCYPEVPFCSMGTSPSTDSANTTPCPAGCDESDTLRGVRLHQAARHSMQAGATSCGPVVPRGQQDVTRVTSCAALHVGEFSRLLLG